LRVYQGPIAPVLGQHRGEGVSVLGVINGRLEEVRERQPAEPGVQVSPGGGRARYRHGQPPAGGQLAMPRRPHRLDAERGRGATLVVARFAYPDVGGTPGGRLWVPGSPTPI